MKINELENILVGKRIAMVERSWGDEGCKITFSDGTVLEFAYSSCEGGLTKFHQGNEVSVVD